MDLLHWIFIILSIQIAVAALGEDTRCSTRSMLQMNLLCCGPRQDDREPLLYLSGADMALGAITTAPEPTASTAGSSIKSASCTTMSGHVLVPPLTAVCCPNPRGRTCCFMPWSAPRPSTGHGIFHIEAKDMWFYVALAAFLLLVGSSLSLLWYFCRSALDRSRSSKLLTLSRPLPPPLYGALSFNQVSTKTLQSHTNLREAFYSKNTYQHGT